MQKINKREKKGESGDIYGRDRPNKPGAIFSIWGSVLERNMQKEGGREEKRGEKWRSAKTS